MTEGLTGAPTQVLAAGGVVWRPGPAGPEVLVVHRPRYDDWSLPKGKLDPGEHSAVAAVREVHEETGLRLTLGRPLPTVRYRVPTAAGQADKVVRYWAMEAPPGAEPAGNGPHEVDEVAWLGVTAASRRLTRHADRAPVHAFATGPLRTATLLLVRHGSAGSRAQWTGSDDDRPLDARGVAQAERLAAVLPAFGPTCLLVAPPLRCRQTAEPLSIGTGLGATDCPELSEDGFPRAPEAAVALLRGSLAEGGTTVAVSQGGVIPELVRRLHGARTPPPGEIRARKGSVWSIVLDAAGVVAAEYDPGLR